MDYLFRKSCRLFDAVSIILNWKLFPSFFSSGNVGFGAKKSNFHDWEISAVVILVVQRATCLKFFFFFENESKARITFFR